MSAYLDEIRVALVCSGVSSWCGGRVGLAWKPRRVVRRRRLQTTPCRLDQADFVGVERACGTRADIWWAAEGAAAVLLKNGNALVAGGADSSVGNFRDTAQQYVPQPIAAIRSAPFISRPAALYAL